MLYRGIIAVSSAIHIKHVNALSADTEFLNVKAGGTYGEKANN
jgi:hypothetical protein